MLVYSNVEKEDMYDLFELGFDEVEIKNSYELMRLSDGKIVLTLFASGKLIVQGKKEFVDNFEKKFKLKTAKKEFFSNKNEHIIGQNVIGSDEALKGDTFGGLVVCAFYCGEDDLELLNRIGVKDSKKFTRNKIIFLADQIKKQFPNNYVIKELYPKDYNDLMSIKNTTEVLDEMHNYVGAALKQKFENVKQVVDEYPGCSVGDIRITQAESKYIAVAAASIIAKAKGLEQIEELSKKSKIKLPLGSTHVKTALNEVKYKKLDYLLYCKQNFKNVKLIFEN